jgi:uncharacterized membrane protein (UPF0127 family)
LIKIQIGHKIFFVEVASDWASWVQGLSGRKELKKNTGMLFSYPSSAIRQFWMKGMSFPLDIILFDTDLIVVGILPNLPIHTSMFNDPPLYSSHVPIQAALEINAFESQGINKGDKLQTIRELQNVRTRRKKKS